MLKVSQYLPNLIRKTKLFMDAAIEKVEREKGSSFSVIAYSSAYFTAPLHIHPEYELILIEEGSGLSFVGDSVRRLAPGDFMLIGKNVPHLWLSADEHYYSNTRLMSRSVYTQFGKDIFPGNLHSIPEMDCIYALLKKSERGIYFHGGPIQEIKDRFRRMVGREGYEKLIGLYDILYALGKNCESKTLTTDKYVNKYDFTSDNIVNKVHIFINQNYQNDLTLDSIASYVGMNPSALSRYYSKRTGRRIFEYLAELRISYALKLLLNKSINIGQIAYDCGYNSLSHFNHQFKQITGYTPTDYAKKVLKARS